MTPLKYVSPLAVFAAVIVAAASASAGLIVNGSFETPLVPNGSYINFAGGSSAIAGWTVVGVDSSIVSTTFAQSGITFNAQGGVQWLDLAGVNSNSMTSGVTQSVATTIGQMYELSFHVGSAEARPFFFPTTVDLSIDGAPACTSSIPPRRPTSWIGSCSRWSSPPPTASPTSRS